MHEVTRLTPREAAARLRMSERTLARMRSEGGGPEFIRWSARAIRYDLDKLEAWEDTRRYRSTSEYDDGAD